MLFTASFLVPLFLLGFPPFLFARKAEEGRDSRFRRTARISYWSNIPRIEHGYAAGLDFAWA